MELKSGITQAKLNPLPGSQAGEEPAALPTGSASSPLLTELVSWSRIQTLL